MSKGKVRNPRKKVKIEEDKRVKEHQKKVEALKKQVHQAKKEAFEASSQWEKMYIVDTEKYKRESVEIKIQMRAEKIKLVEMSNEHQAI